jgi:hypothetical protein
MADVEMGHKRLGTAEVIREEVYPDGEYRMVIAGRTLRPGEKIMGGGISSSGARAVQETEKAYQGK